MTVDERNAILKEIVEGLTENPELQEKVLSFKTANDADVTGYETRATAAEEKFAEMKAKYVDTFFTTPEKVKEDVREDVEKDSKEVSFDTLFVDRVGDYKEK